LPREEFTDVIERFAAEVMPHFRPAARAVG
jgi:hypothetical protein